jgi:FixJ family two-component response regulator
MQVLVVDDDDSLRRALVRTIRLAGCTVEAFPSAEDLLAQQPPSRGSCLVLDLDLPGMNGIDLKHALVKGGRDMPTILITALGEEEVRGARAVLQPVAVLHKPFGKDELLEAIGLACGTPCVNLAAEANKEHRT